MFYASVEANNYIQEYDRFPESLTSWYSRKLNIWQVWWGRVAQKVNLVGVDCL